MSLKQKYNKRATASIAWNQDQCLEQIPDAGNS
jgi:hypothetical protein